MTAIDTKTAGAYHEAAHAVVAIGCGWLINHEGIQIAGVKDGKRDYAGLKRRPSEDTEKARVLVSLAGHLAERMWVGMDLVHTPKDELEEIIYWLVEAGEDEKTQEERGDTSDAILTIMEKSSDLTKTDIFAKFRWYEKHTIDVLARPVVWAGVIGVAEQLQVRGKLSADETEDALVTAGFLKQVGRHNRLSVVDSIEDWRDESRLWR